MPRPRHQNRTSPQSAASSPRLKEHRPYASPPPPPPIETRHSGWLLQTDDQTTKATGHGRRHLQRRTRRNLGNVVRDRCTRTSRKVIRGIHLLGQIRADQARDPKPPVAAPDS
jgi:hypothetical protein